MAFAWRMFTRSLRGWVRYPERQVVTPRASTAAVRKVSNMAPSRSEDRPLLVCRTGNSTNQTGTNDLRREVDISRGSSAAPAVEILREYVVINGQEIIAVDEPGFDDESFGNYDDTLASLSKINEALKYRGRATGQEKDTITICSPDSVQKYGLIVKSVGDSLELDTEDEEINMKDWIVTSHEDSLELVGEDEYWCIEQITEQKAEEMKNQTDVGYWSTFPWLGNTWNRIWSGLGDLWNWTLNGLRRLINWMACSLLKIIGVALVILYVLKKVFIG